MIPKHANPYLLTEQTIVVSRAALREDDEDDLESLDAGSERAQMLARLENILKRSIEEVLPQSTHPGKHTEDGASRKKKRRKVEETKEEQPAKPVAVPFRLLSGMAQPKPIVLTPKASRVIVAIAPAREDTKAEAKRRAARAREVAVDFEWVLNESRKPYCPPPNASKKVRSVTARITSPEPSLLLLEQPKPKPTPEFPHAALVDPTLPVKPSPHLHKATCCRTVTADAPAPPSAVRKSRRRGGGSHQKPVVQAAFWRPQAGMGGKSLGYAWGYEGSWPLAQGEPSRYWRDNMRKAVLE